ncbi:hypothetical protein D3C73_1371270 [compost metagenome]
MQRVVVIAAWTFSNPAAVVAQQRRGKTPAIKKQDNLVISLQMLTHAGDQRRGQSGLYLLTFQIQHVLRRGTGISGATRQAQHAIFFLSYVAQCFQRRCG